MAGNWDSPQPHPPRCARHFPRCGKRAARLYANYPARPLTAPLPLSVMVLAGWLSSPEPGRIQLRRRGTDLPRRRFSLPIQLSGFSRPSSSATMRSRRRARSRLWVAISAARPVRRTRSSSVFMTLSPVAWSRLPVGSSAEQDPGVVGERADDRDALLLAARQPRRPVPGARRKADAVEQLGRLAARPAARDPGDHLRQHDIFERREFRQQVMELVDESRSPSAAARCAARPAGCRNPRRRSAPRRHRGARAAPRHAAMSICRLPTGRPARRSRPAAAPDRPRPAP